MENPEQQELSIEQRLGNLETTIVEVIRRLEFVMGKIRIGMTEFSKTLDGQGKPIPIRQREGSLLDFYTDAQLQQELENATQNPKK